MAIQTYTAGQILTAASMTSLQQQAVMTFTTEAARDTALPSPTEGMMAYLTAPTVPAATGEYTKLPTGIFSVYNGTSWTCLTPVGAETTTGGTTSSSSFTATLSGGGTNPSVTLTTGTTALVTISSWSGTPGTGGFIFAAQGVAVSGASTIAAADRWALNSGNGTASPSGFGATFIFTGLTAGTNTFTLQYKSNSGTGSWSNRNIIVAGCL
jgi:hypothetical protein